MTRWIRAALLGIGVLVVAPVAANAATIIINFDSYNEFDTPGEQGVTFTNATVYTSGAIGGTLNELDFPPRSDFNVGFDDLGGPMVLQFATPIVSFTAYFTYNTQLALTALDGATIVDTTSSSSSANFASVGTPNEQLTLSFAGGFNRVEILGDVAGFSFTIDDITAETRGEVVVAPEPASMWLLGLGAAALVRRRARYGA